MRRGLTLIELIVALTVLGTSMAVAGAALTTAPPAAPAALLAALGAARAAAITEGRARSVLAGGQVIRFEPDGSVRSAVIPLASRSVRLDPLSGFAHVTPR